MSDPIADMIIRIKNAQAVKKETVDIPYSNLKHKLAQVLSKQGFVGEVEKKYSKTRKIIRIGLKYNRNQPAITGFRRVSKPGRRVYLPVKELKGSTKAGGIFIISTPQGLMPISEARKKKMGGEVMAEIW